MSKETSLRLSVRIEGEYSALTIFEPDENGQVVMDLDPLDSDDPYMSDRYTLNVSELTHALKKLMGGE